MNNDSPQKAVLVVFAVALVCSVLVSAASIVLRPIQERNQLVERSRNIVTLTGLTDPSAPVSDDDILAIVDQLDIRVVELDSGDFADPETAESFDSRRALSDPEQSQAIPAELDIAGLGRRSLYERVYLVWHEDELQRVIFPVQGQGMWSTIRGFIALEQDMNTIGAVSFYEQAETAGLGDQIQRPDWQAQWTGRRLFSDNGAFMFRVGPGSVEPGSFAATHQVDGLTGATVTGDAVTRIIAYWFGPNGYSEFIDRLLTDPPARQAATGDNTL